MKQTVLYGKFILDNPRRRSSIQTDFGYDWSDGPKGFPRYRVSFIHDTGELYAIELSNGPVSLMPVEILGHFDNNDQAIRTLDGWDEVLHEPGSLEWVRSRAIAGARG